MAPLKENSARDFFLHALSITTLYMSTISLLIIVFQIIQYFVPDILDMSMYYRPADAIRTPVAILFIAFPIYAWSVWYLAKLMKQEPEMIEFRLRKWLMYLTVFVSAIVMIITLITVVYNFLNGDLTLRFFLQVLSVLLVSGMAFYYYLVTVKQEGNKMVLRGVEIVTISFFVLSLVGSFVIMGSPKEQRLRRIDDQRVSSLQNMHYAVQNYYTEFKTLPTSTEQIFKKVDPGMVASDRDPETNELYVYEVTGTTTYKLCATFSTVSYEREVQKGVTRPVAALGSDYDWTHDEGYYCFDRKIDVSVLKQFETAPVIL
jgi:hypothetical protein